MRRSTRILTIGTAAAIVAIGGTTAALAADHDDDTPSARATPPAVSLDTAEHTARAAVPGTRVTEAEIEHEHGRTVWEVELTAEAGKQYDITLDATTGKILSQTRDDYRGDDRAEARSDARGDDHGDHRGDDHADTHKDDHHDDHGHDD